MKLKKNDLVIVVLVVVVMLAILGNQSGLLKPGASSGYVISLQPTAFTTNTDSDLTGSQKWVANVVLGTGGDSLVGKTTYTSNANILTDPNTGKTSAKPIQVSFSLDKMNVVYPLSLDSTKQPNLKKINNIGLSFSWNDARLELACYGQPFSTINMEAGKCYAIPSWCVGTENGYNYRRICHDNGGVAVTCSNPIQVWGIPIASYSGYECINVVNKYDTANAVIYKPGPKIPQIEATITTTVGSKTETIKLNQDNGFFGVSPDKLVLARMTGALTSFNQEVPEAGTFYVIKSGSNMFPIGANKYNNIWTDATLYDKWKTQTSYDGVQTVLTTYNAQVSDAFAYPDDPFNNTKDIAGNQQNSPNRYIKITDSQLIVDRTRDPMLFPMLTMEISADYLAINRSITEPVITSVIPATFKVNSDTQQKITVVVKNAGEQSGEIALSYSCTPPVLQLSSQLSQFVAGGATANYDIYFKGTKNGTYSCSVTAKNADLSKTSTKTFTGEVTQVTPKPCPSNYVFDPAANDCICRTDLASICTGNQKPNYQLCRCDSYIPPCSKVCGEGEVLQDDCTCKACTPPRSLSKYEYFNTSKCTINCIAGYYYNVQGECVPSSVCNNNNICEPDLGETKDNCADCLGLSCFEKVDAVPCNKLDMGITKIDDPFCGLNKAIGEAGCVAQEAGIMCVAGVIIVLAFGIAYLTKKKKRR